MGQVPKHHNWSERKKALLRDRILTSASHVKGVRRLRRRKRVFIAAAAMIPALIALGFLFREPAEPTLQEFVRGMSKTESLHTDKVTVILGQGERVAMEEEEGHVEYSATGSNVQLGSGKTVEQQVEKDNAPIFNTVLVPYGKRSFLKLSDGTKVWINSGSKMVFPAVFSGNTREVFLEGEAIFEVAHNKQKPFRVHSNTQKIEVLGTVFNVSNYPEDNLMETVLKTGSIRITYQQDDKNSFLIKPGTLSSYDRASQKISTQKVNVDDYFSWRNGFLTLANHSLKEITTRLSRYYNQPIEIKGDKLSTLTFSGRLDLSEKLEQILKTIQETTNFQIIKQNETILLTQ